MTATTSGLVLERIEVRFGGLTAVHALSLNAAPGSITGLIGPNGAGKTTSFNACTGVVPVTTGTVHLEGHELRGGPAARAQAGLGRTFQRMELFDTMSVAENIGLGPEALLAGRRPWAQLRAARGQRVDVATRAAEAMARCGLDSLADRRVGQLSTGQRRLVELARAIASQFRFLLLDEPSSGLDVGETERFGEILETIIAEDGTGILLVEHDMALVRMVCRYAYVLDFGELIFEGPTAEVLGSDIVKAAYLGSEAVEAAV